MSFPKVLGVSMTGTMDVDFLAYPCQGEIIVQKLLAA